MKKRFSILFLILILIISNIPAALAEAAAQMNSRQSAGQADYDFKADIKNDVVLFIGKPRAYVNGVLTRVDAKDADVKPFIENDRAYLPVRFISEAFGAKVDYNDETKTVAIELGDKKITLVIGQNVITINDVAAEIEAPAKVVGGRIFVPVRAISEALTKKVVWDNRGLIAINGDGSTFEAAGQKLVDALVKEFQKPLSSDIKHPLDASKSRWMLASFERAYLTSSDDDIKNEIADVMKMDDKALADYIDAQEATITNIDMRAPHEKLAMRLGQMYAKTNDETYAKKAAIIIYRSALHYKDVSPDYATSIFMLANSEPILCVYGYDLIYNSPVWDELAAQEKTDVRGLVENWFRQVMLDLEARHLDLYMDNQAGYGIKHLAGMAVILNDPELVRIPIRFIDVMMSGLEFQADGMWHEGTYSYGQMAAGNVQEAINFIKLSYSDPYGYEDKKLGLKLNYTDLSSRWPLINAMLQNTKEGVYPDGSPIAIHDTHPKDPALKTANDPIKPEWLNNIELNHFGFYTIKQGDTQNASAMSLLYPPISEGPPYSAGHFHGDSLSMTMWAGGMELLPDPGYPANTKANRYVHMNSEMHNLSFIWSKSVGNYANIAEKYTRPALLAYDPGTKNDKTVQLIEASHPGPPETMADIKRRLLMLIKIDGDRTYSVDIQKLKGGDVHENFLRATEEEDNEQNVSIPLTKNTGTLGDYLRGVNKSGGLAINQPAIASPMTGDGSKDFNFSWTGIKNGTTLKAYIKGIPNSIVAFSRIPTLRWTYNKPEIKDNFPGWHYYQRCDVAPSDVTVFGAVYEGWRKEQSPLINKVEWVSPQDSDPLCTAAVVETDSFRDIIYSSNDTKKRKVDDITFAGRIAIIRLDKKTGKPVWGYVYGDGKVQSQGFIINGIPDYQFKVIKAEGSLDGSIPNSIKIRGVLPSDGSVDGLWLRTVFGDGSAKGFRIEKVNQSIIELSNHPGFELTQQGAKMLFFPSKVQPQTNKIDVKGTIISKLEDFVIPGDVWMELCVPTFKENK